MLRELSVYRFYRCIDSWIHIILRPYFRYFYKSGEILIIHNTSFAKEFRKYYSNHKIINRNPISYQYLQYLRDENSHSYFSFSKKIKKSTCHLFLDITNDGFEKIRARWSSRVSPFPSMGINPRDPKRRGSKGGKSGKEGATRAEDKGKWLSFFFFFLFFSGIKERETKSGRCARFVWS